MKNSQAKTLVFLVEWRIWLRPRRRPKQAWEPGQKLPSGAKALLFVLFTARLKPCPFKKRGFLKHAAGLNEGDAKAVFDRFEKFRR
jgi:hypothetical protein